MRMQYIVYLLAFISLSLQANEGHAGNKEASADRSSSEDASASHSSSEDASASHSSSERGRYFPPFHPEDTVDPVPPPHPHASPPKRSSSLPTRLDHHSPQANRLENRLAARKQISQQLDHDARALQWMRTYPDITRQMARNSRMPVAQASRDAIGAETPYPEPLGSRAI